MDPVMQAMQGGGAPAMQAPPDPGMDPAAMQDQPGQMAAAIAMLLARKAEEAHQGVDAAVQEEVTRLQAMIAQAAASPEYGTLSGPMPMVGGEG